MRVVRLEQAVVDDRAAGDQRDRRKQRDTASGHAPGDQIAQPDGHRQRDDAGQVDHRDIGQRVTVDSPAGAEHVATARDQAADQVERRPDNRRADRGQVLGVAGRAGGGQRCGHALERHIRPRELVGELDVAIDRQRA